MSKKDNNILDWFLGLGLLWLIAGRTAYAATRLGFKLAGIRPQNVSSARTVVNIDIAVKNPTNYNLFLRDISCLMYLSGVPVGEVRQVVNRQLFYKSVTVITLQVTLNNCNIVDQFISQLQSGIYNNWELNLVGNIAVVNSRVPFNIRLYADDLFR